MTIKRFHKTWLLGLLMVTGLFLAVTGMSTAQEPAGGHPLYVMKARYVSERGTSALASARGNCTVWLRNKEEVTVDGIEIELHLYNDRRRQVETLKREIGALTAGEKKVVTFRWDIPGEDEVERPRIWLSYNARGTQKARFEAEPPTWQ